MIFLVAAALLLVLQGNRLVFTNDEGILLEPAQRIASGAQPYTGFFAYMSPGSYWLQAFVFRWLGVSLWTGRVPVILDFALQCALIYWLTALLASWRAAVAVILMFAGFQAADPSFLTAQHRWDSATFALAGLCVAAGSMRRSTSSPQWAISGALLGAAAWCTPSVGLVAAIAVLWIAVSRERRKALIPFAAGILAVSVMAVGLLAANGSFGAFLSQMTWLKHNYSSVNVMSYGSVIGGYGPLLEGAAGFEWIVRAVLVACVALPALLPPVAVILWLIVWWRNEWDQSDRTMLVLLLPAMIALVMTAFPRADVMHLAFVAALPYVLSGAAVARLVSARVARPVSCVMVLLAGIFGMNLAVGWRAATLVSSPVGSVRVAKDQASNVQKLLAAVHPGQSLYVHPYMPFYYFLTQARNPTRYSFLSPGMMTSREEQEVLKELQADPPEWLLYLDLHREEFLRIFPQAAGLYARFETLESWLDIHYRPVQDPGVNVAGYQLWQRVSPEVSKLQ